VVFAAFVFGRSRVKHTQAYQGGTLCFYPRRTENKYHKYHKYHKYPRCIRTLVSLYTI
jgi:hypothetical protein